GLTLARKRPAVVASAQRSRPLPLVRQLVNVCAASRLAASWTRTVKAGGNPKAGGVLKSPRRRTLPFAALARSFACARCRSAGTVVVVVDDVVAVVDVLVGTMARQSARMSSEVWTVPPRSVNDRAERR